MLLFPFFILLQGRKSCNLWAIKYIAFKCFEGVVSCITKPEPEKALTFTRGWREGEDRLEDGTEQVLSDIPQADVLRDYEGAGSESAAMPPQPPLATLAPRLGFAAGFSVKSGQGQPHLLIPEVVASASAACNKWNFLVKISPPFFFFFSFFFLLPFQITGLSLVQPCVLFSLLIKNKGIGHIFLL